MRSIFEFLSTKVKPSIIKATNETIRQIVRDEIKHLGNEADLNHIDVSEVTNMYKLFYYKAFNGDISNWDVSNVEDMSCMFYNSLFNGDISKWDVSKVEDMYAMFYDSEFNGDISEWDVSNVKNMSDMFKGCPLEFNPPKWYKNK